VNGLDEILGTHRAQRSGCVTDFLASGTEDSRSQKSFAMATASGGYRTAMSFQTCSRSRMWTGSDAYALAGLDASLPSIRTAKWLYPPCLPFGEVRGVLLRRIGRLAHRPLRHVEDVLR